MKMMSSTMFGVVLAVAMFSVGAVVDRVTNVYVTNFPLDPQGNIKVTEMNKDQSVNITNWPQNRWEERLVYNKTNLGELPNNQFIYLNTTDVTGYKTVTVFAKVVGDIHSTGASLHIHPYFNSYGLLGSGLKSYDNSFEVDITSTPGPALFCGSNTFDICSTKLEIYVLAPTYVVARVDVLTITVYLQN